MKEFKRFKDLFVESKHTTKKFKAELEKDAIVWFEKEFSAKHSYSDSDKFQWYYDRSGLLFFKVNGLGAYYYIHIIKAIHFEHWKLEAFRQGYEAGESETIYDNPYYETQNFYYDSAWSYGLNCGIKKYSFFA